MSSFSEKPVRADARRNAERILDAAADLLASDPGVSLEQVAAGAGVSRATLYHHFAGREALLDALTARSVLEVTAAVRAARPQDGTAAEAMERVLRAAWQVVGRYRGLVMVNPRRLEPAELRHRLEPALAPLAKLIRRGQRSGEFDPAAPVDWLIGVTTDLIHSASGQVTAGTMDPGAAERLLLRTATAVLAAHRTSSQPSVSGR